jgi:SAM-dependent methyltransferase
MFNSQEILASYRGERGERFQDTCVVPTRMYPIVARVRAGKFQPYIDNKHDDVLEYGVGQGYNLAELKCRTKAGFDVADFLADALAAHGISFHDELTASLDESFDVVICHHVLEHLTNPWESLEQMRRLIRTGGRLLLFVPYEVEGSYRRFDPHNPNGHLFSWTPQTIGKLCTSTGFTIEEIQLQKFGYDRFSAVLTNTLHGGIELYLLLRTMMLLLQPHYEIKVVLRKT